MCEDGDGIGTISVPNHEIEYSNLMRDVKLLIEPIIKDKCRFGIIPENMPVGMVYHLVNTLMKEGICPAFLRNGHMEIPHFASRVMLEDEFLQEAGTLNGSKLKKYCIAQLKAIRFDIAKSIDDWDKQRCYPYGMTRLIVETITAKNVDIESPAMDVYNALTRRNLRGWERIAELDKILKGNEV